MSECNDADKAGRATLEVDNEADFELPDLDEDREERLAEIAAMTFTPDAGSVIQELIEDVACLAARLRAARQEFHKLDEAAARDRQARRKAEAELRELRQFQLTLGQGMKDAGERMQADAIFGSAGVKATQQGQPQARSA